jgi:hypothetical protein
MKLTKLAILAAAATVALGAYSSKAAVTIVGTTTSYGKANISATIVTNKPSTYNSSTYTYKYTTGTFKVTNKDLLKLMADWSTNSLTEWQTAGAQLIYDFNSDQICVADKTSTNILFYAGDGVYSSGAYDKYLDFNPYYDDGAYTGTYVNHNPGNDVYTETYNSYFEIYQWDGVSSDYIELWAYAQNTSHYSDHWKSGVGAWSETDSASPAGSAEIYTTSYNASFKAKVSISGKGNYTY